MKEPVDRCPFCGDALTVQQQMSYGFNTWYGCGTQITQGMTFEKSPITMRPDRRSRKCYEAQIKNQATLLRDTKAQRDAALANLSDCMEVVRAVAKGDCCCKGDRYNNGAIYRFTQTQAADLVKRLEERKEEKDVVG